MFQNIIQALVVVSKDVNTYNTIELTQSKKKGNKVSWSQWFVSFSSAGRLPCCMEPFLEQVKSVLQFKTSFSFPDCIYVQTTCKGKTGDGDEARHLRLEEALKEVRIGTAYCNG